MTDDHDHDDPADVVENVLSTLQGLPAAYVLLVDPIAGRTELHAASEPADLDRLRAFLASDDPSTPGRTYDDGWTHGMGHGSIVAARCVNDALAGVEVSPEIEEALREGIRNAHVENGLASHEDYADLDAVALRVVRDSES